MEDILRSIPRHLIVHALFFLPYPRRRRIERWLRGREEYRKLQLADCVLMSWGKSGRTWLRVMLSRFYQQRYGLSQDRLLEFDNLRRANPAIPAILFTHNNYLRDYTGNYESKAHFHGKKIVLLVRDPRDVAVSQFFQWKYRMRPSKKRLNDYPPHGSDISMFDFVVNPSCGIPRIVGYFNGWARAMPELDDLVLVRYEDLRTDTHAVMTRIFAFLGTPASEAEVRDAVQHAAYENMKKLEEKNAYHRSGARVVPGRRGNPSSYKVRRAKVGGYRDYFDAQQLERIDAAVTGLDPMFGYGPRDPAETAEPPSPAEVDGAASSAPRS
jgi:hypothetical protein